MITIAKKSIAQYLGCLILCFFVANSSGWAQRFDHLNYNLGQGLSQSNTSCIYPDRQGYLWVGTRGGGLNRFDGLTFEATSQREGLASNTIECISQDAAKRLWVATNTGLQVRDAQGWQTIALPKNCGTIGSLLPYQDSIVLAGTDKGFFIINAITKKGKRFRGSNSLSYAAVSCLTADEKGQVWIGTSKGIFKYEGVDQPTHFSLNEGIKENNVVSILPQDNGRLLIIYKDVSPANFFPNQKISKDYTSTIVPQKIKQGLVNDQGLWLLSNTSGIHFLAKGDSSWQTLNTLPSRANQFTSIVQDQSGQVWMSTADQGIFKIIEVNFNNFLSGTKLPAGSITAINYDSSNKLWIGNQNGALLFQESDNFVPFTNHSGYVDASVSSIAIDRNDRKWIAVNGKGIALIDSLGLYKILTMDQGLPSNNIEQLLFSQPQKLWALTDQGQLTCIHIKMVDSIEYFEIQTIAEPMVKNIQRLGLDVEDQLWACSERGILLMLNDEGQPQKILNQQHGLPSDVILNINFDNFPEVWVSMAGRGLLRADFNQSVLRFRSPTFNNRLRSHNIQTMAMDLQGHWWFGHEKGLDKVTVDDQVHYYGKNQGIGIGPIRVQNSANRNFENIWLGGNQGLIAIDPKGAQQQIATPTISFESIDLFYEPLAETDYKQFVNPDQSLQPGLTLHRKENNFGFKFKGAQINFPKLIKYQWRLEPIEKKWSPLSKQSNVNYANLQPGKYNFIVKSTIDGNHFSEPIAANFTIKGPIWQKTSFQLIAFLLGAVLISGMIYGYSRRLKARESARAERLALENNLLILNQKALQLQMNPHYIFNTLNSINALVAKGANREARVQINTFAKQLRNTLSNSRSDTISLEKEIESLDQYLKMLQFSHPTDFDFEIKVKPGLDTEEIELPPMLIQPFVENSVLHGFNKLDKKGKITITFSQKGMLLYCSVHDNGIGRVAARKNKKADHQSHALEVTLERLDALKGALKYQSLQFNDLSEDNKSAGTEVIIQMPYQVNY